MIAYFVFGIYVAVLTIVFSLSFMSCSPGRDRRDCSLGLFIIVVTIALSFWAGYTAGVL